MTLQLLHPEFSYLWGKVYFIFYQCSCSWLVIFCLGPNCHATTEQTGRLYFWDPPLPHPQARVSPHPLVYTLLCGRGGGRSQFGRGDGHSGTLGIYVLCARYPFNNEDCFCSLSVMRSILLTKSKQGKYFSFLLSIRINNFLFGLSQGGKSYSCICEHLNAHAQSTRQWVNVDIISFLDWVHVKL